jgi:hypothetical protein
LLAWVPTNTILVFSGVNLTMPDSMGAGWAAAPEFVGLSLAAPGWSLGGAGWLPGAPSVVSAGALSVGALSAGLVAAPSPWLDDVLSACPEPSVCAWIGLVELLGGEEVLVVSEAHPAQRKQLIAARRNACLIASSANR